MISYRRYPIIAVTASLILAVLACQFPQTNSSTPISVQKTFPPNPGSPIPKPSQPPEVAIYPTARPTIQQAQGPHRISTHRIFGIAEFYDRLTSQRFIPRGVNYRLILPVLDHYEDRLFAVSVYNHDRTQADFVTLSGAGYNTVRIILDGCTSGDGCIGKSNGHGLNQDYLDNIVDLMNLARENKLFLLLAMSDLPEQGGYARLAMAGVNQDLFSGHNATYLTNAGIQASQTYWSDLLSGLIDRQAPFEVVLGWEIQAEQYYRFDQPPFSLTSSEATIGKGHEYDLSNPAQKKVMAMDGLRTYIAQLRQTILDHDPTALVSMGFIAPNSPNTWREGDYRYVDTAGLLSDSALDFFDFHAYPGEKLSLSQVAQNFGLTAHVDKPILMGEVGAYTWTYPEVSQGAIAVQDWIAASCTSGFSGWIYQGYYPSPAGQAEATWGFVDGANTILYALAPADQPDPCITTVLPGRNLALGKQVTVSAALPDQSPQMAVDGDLITQWSAGEYPMQWIEIDLGSPASIGEIRLTVGQWPAGDTVHELWVGASHETMLKVHEFSGNEYDFDVLSFTPKTPLNGIRYVRLVTTESPSWVSWREIEVFAPYPTTPTPAPELTLTPTP